MTSHNKSVIRALDIRGAVATLHTHFNPVRDSDYAVRDMVEQRYPRLFAEPSAKLEDIFDSLKNAPVVHRCDLNRSQGCYFFRVRDLNVITGKFRVGVRSQLGYSDTDAESRIRFAYSVESMELIRFVPLSMNQLKQISRKVYSTKTLPRIPIPDSVAA